MKKFFYLLEAGETDEMNVAYIERAELIKGIFINQKLVKQMKITLPKWKLN